MSEINTPEPSLVQPQQRVFDRVAKFDPRSRSYRTVELIPHNLLRSYTWACPAWNDQGMEGACVGFAFSHELAARPAMIPTDNFEARAIYQDAQKVDEWEGEDYDGTSVLAGVKAVRARHPGAITEYRWAFGLEDLVRVLGFRGPAVLGVNWYSGMFETDVRGFVRVDGYIAGGHAILARGVKIVWQAPLYGEDRRFVNVDLDKSFITLRNSWGPGWGYKGDCRITLRDMGRLLNESGEACVPTVRGK